MRCISQSRNKFGPASTAGKEFTWGANVPASTVVVNLGVWESGLGHPAENPARLGTALLK